VIASTASDFFNSGTWLVIRNLLIFFAVVFWAATVWWIYKDAKRRIEDPWLVGMSVLLGVAVPFFGPFLIGFVASVIAAPPASGIRLIRATPPSCETK